MFLGNFSSQENVFSAFDFNDQERMDRTIIYAKYDQGDYDSEAVVIYIEQGKLYQIDASHCSCFGLEAAEGKNKPFEIDFETLKGFCERGVSAYGADYSYVLDHLVQRNNENPEDLEDFFAEYILLGKLGKHN